MLAKIVVVTHHIFIQAQDGRLRILHSVQRLCRSRLTHGLSMVILVEVPALDVQEPL